MPASVIAVQLTLVYAKLVLVPAQVKPGVPYILLRFARQSIVPIVQLQVFFVCHPGDSIFIAIDNVLIVAHRVAEIAEAIRMRGNNRAGEHRNSNSAHGQKAFQVIYMVFHCFLLSRAQKALPPSHKNPAI
jgi:hypothetical protein